MIGQISPIAMANIGWKFYMLFVCLNLVDLIAIILFFPETKGKTLEEMNTVFGDQVTFNEKEGTEEKELATQEKAAILTKVLRYPMCTEEVVKHLLQHLPEGVQHIKASKFDVPRRLFRSLASDNGPIDWERDPRFQFLQYLFDSPGIPDPNLNSFDGYALTKAVHARCIPLVRFLLKHGADPQQKNCLAVFVAIRQKDLALVKLLIERDDSPYTELPGTGKRKRRRFEDRVIVNAAMLRAAVKCDARDIVNYLAWEKGCVPDMQTLHMMTS
ncbi:hypothetical protein C0991_010663 [Blastosporella zonata]|nr:hypothetical protein C0991_010663 [Blastosporella zonata]